MQRSYWSITAGFVATRDEAEATLERIEEVCSHGTERPCDRDFLATMGVVTQSVDEPSSWLLHDQLNTVIFDLLEEGIVREQIMRWCDDAITQHDLR